MPTFATPGPITATLTTGGARVRLTASERSDTVVHVEPIDSTNKSDVHVAERTKVDFVDGELSIKTIKAGAKSGSVAITVELPAGSRLALSTAWTDVHAQGRFGDCELDVASGQVEIDNAATVRGRLAGGAVAIASVAGAAIIDGGAAGLRIGEVTGTVKYAGASGQVWIGHAMSDVDFGSASGSFNIDRAEGSVVAKAGNCPIRVGRMTRGQAELINASGGIEIGIGEGTNVRVDARSTKGAVRNSLPAHDRSGNEVTVYARTRLDDIVIRATA